jgi:hypothetical protein
MKQLLQLEYLTQWAAAYALTLWFDFPAWWFWAWLLVPDLSMLGYLVNTRWGAWAYNLVHHQFSAFLLAALGLGLDVPYLLFAGLLLWGHIGMDRLFGYGLKYEEGFKFTHLGKIGQEKEAVA